MLQNHLKYCTQILFSARKHIDGRQDESFEDDLRMAASGQLVRNETNIKDEFLPDGKNDPEALEALAALDVRVVNHAPFPLGKV